MKGSLNVNYKVLEVIRSRIKELVTSCLTVCIIPSGSMATAFYPNCCNKHVPEGVPGTWLYLVHCTVADFQPKDRLESLVLSAFM